MTNAHLAFQFFVQLAVILAFCHFIGLNTRGLMELIIINIGLQRGIISEGLSASLVIMAVVTTLMACPLFDWIAADISPQLVTPESDEDALVGVTSRG